MSQKASGGCETKRQDARSGRKASWTTYWPAKLGAKDARVDDALAAKLGAKDARVDYALAGKLEGEPGPSGRTEVFTLREGEGLLQLDGRIVPATFNCKRAAVAAIKVERARREKVRGARDESDGKNNRRRC